MTQSGPIYSLRDLVIDLYTSTVTVRAVDGVSLDARPGETLAIVGESGSGKTVMTLGPLGLLPEGVTVKMTGSAQSDGRELIGARARDLSALRGREFGVIFQDPISALNPMWRIGPQIASQSRRLAGLSQSDAQAAALSLLKRTGIPDPEDRYGRYPHELSGGMLQRVMIALALAGRPRVLIADEPTTALDATVQAQILDLLRQIQREDGLAIILITHDIGVVAAVADRVIVLYGGQVAEQGTTLEVLTRPVHPYTRGLLASVPDFRRASGEALQEIPGMPPSQTRLEPGCRFAERCASVQRECRIRRPVLEAVSQPASCHLAACPVELARLREHSHG